MHWKGHVSRGQTHPIGAQHLIWDSDAFSDRAADREISLVITEKQLLFSLMTAVTSLSVLTAIFQVNLG